MLMGRKDRHTWGVEGDKSQAFAIAHDLSDSSSQRMAANSDEIRGSDLRLFDEFLSLGELVWRSCRHPASIPRQRLFR